MRLRIFLALALLIGAGALTVTAVGSSSALPPDRKAPTKTTSSSARTVDFDPVFSPDGQTVAFVRTPIGDRGAIMLIRADGGGLHTVVPNVLVHGLNWSPDGSSLVYAASGALWIVEVASGEIRQLNFARIFGGPSWSPDGRTIAYSRWGETGCGGPRGSWINCIEIWLVGADGSNDHRVVLHGGRPLFSPDGSMLALSWAPSLAVDLDGKDVLPQRARWVENLAATAWSPRGVYVAYTARGLWLANVMTKSVRRLTPFVDSKPSWSPDGKVIAATRSRPHSLVALVRVKDGKVFKRFPRSNGNRSFAS